MQKVGPTALLPDGVLSSQQAATDSRSVDVTTWISPPGDERSTSERESDASEVVPLTRPSVPAPIVLGPYLDKILSSGVLTNGPFVREVERAAAACRGVGQCIAVASCTAGLMLVIRGSGLSGDVVVPSFTFMATAHAVAWNGLRPVFADIDSGSLTLSPEAAERVIGVRTSAIL